MGRAQLDRGELAYLAGVLDTRAVVKVRYLAGSGRERIRVTALPYVAMSTGDAELLEWLAGLTGVRSVVTERGYDKHRCLEHCTEAHEHIRSVSGRWSLTGVRATVLLCGTREWVRFSGQAWDGAIQAGIAAPYKQGVLDKMVGLGWPLPVAWSAL